MAVVTGVAAGDMSRVLAGGYRAVMARRTGAEHVHVIDAIDRKVEYMRFYGRNFDNVEMATL